jgi:hypothetical protein
MVSAVKYGRPKNVASERIASGRPAEPIELTVRPPENVALPASDRPPDIVVVPEIIRSPDKAVVLPNAMCENPFWVLSRDDILPSSAAVELAPALLNDSRPLVIEAPRASSTGLSIRSAEMTEAVILGVMISSPAVRRSTARSDAVEEELVPDIRVESIARESGAAPETERPERFESSEPL